MKSTSYPINWYEYLKEGDKVKSVKPYFNTIRQPGDILTIFDSSIYSNIRYIGIDNKKHASKKYDDFIPIKMKAFPNLNKTFDYEIF